MPLQIWNFPLLGASVASGDVQIEMPYTHKILTVREKGEDIYLWAEVDTTSPMIARRFRIIGTGRDLPDASLTYIGTGALYDGRLVLHVYAYD